MRNIPAPLQTHIQQEVLALSRCIKITRGDGVIIRITNHDVDVPYNGDRYLSGIPMDISALESTDTLSVDNADITLGIDGDLITVDDLDSGLFDNAAFEMFIVNWENPGNGIIPLKRGTLGDVEIVNGITAKIQLRGLTYLLQRPIVEKYSLTCRVALGSKRCGAINSPIRIRRQNQKVKTWDWFLIPTNAVPYSLLDASFEAPSPDAWTIPSGSLWKQNDEFTPFNGSFFIEGDSGTQGQDLVIYQDVTTSDLGFSDSNVDAGRFSIDFSAQIARTLSSVKNPGKVYIEQYDSIGNSLKRDETDWVVGDYQVWQGIGVTSFVLPNCRNIRFGLINRINEGTAGGVAFDSCAVQSFTNEVSTWGNAIFRTVKLPSRQADEMYGYTNPSFEAQIPVGNTTVSTAITGWTIAAGSFWRTVNSIGSLNPLDGGVFLFGGNNASGVGGTEYSISQAPTFSEAHVNAQADNVTDGWYHYEVVWSLARTDADASGKVDVDFLDETGVIISSLTSGYITPAAVDSWEQHSLGARIPSGTRSIRLTLNAKSGVADANANIGFDGVKAYMVPTAYEHVNDQELGHLSSMLPTYDYGINNYTRDGEALVQARTPTFGYGAVTTVTSNRVFSSDSINLAPEVFYSGRITWLSGQNAGRSSYVRIWDNDAKQAKLYAELKKPIQIGDKFVFSKGCDKTIDTCADVFGNAHNFRGEPYLPGPSKVIEYLSQTTEETNT